MAWPTEAGALNVIRAPLTNKKRRASGTSWLLQTPYAAHTQPFFIASAVRPPARNRRTRSRSRLQSMASWRGAAVTFLGGYYRIANDAEYRIRWNNQRPPLISDPVNDTTSDIDGYSPTVIFGDGTWYFSVSEFDGFTESPFKMLGPNQETYLRIDINSSVQTISPPQPPAYWQLEKDVGGKVKVIAAYAEKDTNGTRADEYVMSVTTDGSIPPLDTADYTFSIKAKGIQKMVFRDIPAQADGTTVNIRLQTRRNDSGIWVYSESILTALDELNGYRSIIADAQGPIAPPAGIVWPGPIPEEI